VLSKEKRVDEEAETLLMVPLIIDAKKEAKKERI